MNLISKKTYKLNIKLQVPLKRKKTGCGVLWTSLSWPSSVLLLTSRLFPWLHPLEMDYLSWHFAEYNFKFKVHRMCGYSLSFAWDAILLWTRPILWVSMRFIFKHNFPITYKFWENNFKNVCLAESCCTCKTLHKTWMCLEWSVINC